MTKAFRSRGFHALAHDFCIHAESVPIGRYLEAILSGFPEPVSVEHEYLVRPAAQPTAPGSTEIVRIDVDGDGEEVVASSEHLGTLAGSFVHHLNRMAIDADYAVMCHAGGVQRDDLGVVLPADPESGKTTLTAGLVRAGFAYLSDEAVVFGDDTGAIEPYPKPLSIDAGSQHLFPELEPAPAPGDDGPPEDQWQVPPDAIRPGAVGTPCRARLIVFPKYEADAVTELAPRSRAAGLLELATNTFDFRDHPRRSLARLADVVRGARCFRLAVGDLDEACALITKLVEDGGGQDRA
jgi:hypothetical protein